MSAQTAENPAASLDGDPIDLSKRYQILPGSRLPHLDSPHAKAYEARDTRHRDRELFGLVCDRGLPPRLDVMKPLAQSESLSFISPEHWAIVHWTPADEERYVIVFEQPNGERAFVPVDGKFQPIREDELVRKVVKPLLNVLLELKNRHIPHRAIRAENLFYGDASRETVVLGECVSEPPAYSQPVIYEPIEMGMAQPSGRGGGRVTDDIYAMGVLLVVLLHGGDPCAGMSDEEVVTKKLQRGSYATLLSNSRVSLALMEPLRGMLCDEPGDRWTAQDLQMWMNGRKQTPRQALVPPRVSRPFEFAGQEHTNLRCLADAMALNWDEAVQAVKGDRLREWLENCQTAERSKNPILTNVVRMLSMGASGDQRVDQLTGRILISLDPIAPIRFKQFRARLDALGQALAMEFQKKETTEVFVEIIRGKLSHSWLEAQASASPDFVHLKKNAELMEFFANRNGWGYGIERCLYELCENWPCQSPILKKFLVSDVAQLLPALERIAREGPPDFEPVDRHIAAFCAAQVKQLPDRTLVELDQGAELATRRIGILRMLATVQQATDRQALPNMARWLVRLLSPVIEKFHNRPYRQQLGTKIQEVAAEGDVVGLLNLVDNETARERDIQGFEAAKALFEKSGREIRWLEEGGLTDKNQVMRGSRQAATLLSSVLSGLTLLVLTIMFVS